MRKTILIALCLAVAACNKGTPKGGITVLIESPPDTLDGRMYLSAWGGRVSELVSPGLIRFDDKLQPEGDLAESFTRLDDRRWQFVLRDQLTFHDGSPVTAADVKATFENLKAIKSPRAEKYAAVEWIEAKDARTVVFHLKYPYAPLLSELSLAIVPASRASGEAAKEQDKAPIGAGPFKFVSWADEDHVELVPFEGYYGGAPKISALHIRVVRDETTRVLELLKGRADLCLSVGPPVIPVLEKSDSVKVLSTDGLGFAYLLPNVRSGPLQDARVRQAICHGLALDPVVETKFHGLATKATGFLPATHWAYEKTEGCDYDPERAKKLLDEAGFPDPDGDGPKPRFTLSYKTSTDRFRKSIALIFREQLAQVGIDADVRALEFGTLFADIKKGNFELTSLKWSTVFEPDLMRQVFATSAIPSEQNNFVGFNRGGYRNSKLDALLDEAMKAAPEQRRTLYAEAQKVMETELPYIPLWHEKNIAVVSRRLEGFAPDANGDLRRLEQAREVKP